MIVQKQFKILDNKKVADNIYKMVLDSSSVYNKALPGQFVHVRGNNSYKPLLRRPFSIYKIDSGNMSILYKVVGEGTFCLSQHKNNEKIDVLGPLGNHFVMPEGKKKIFFIAGGMGIAPISFLIDFFVEKKVGMMDNIKVIFGVRKSEELILKDDLKKNKYLDLHLLTEDGKEGKKGTTIECFENLIKKEDNSNCLVYAAGPIAMFRALKKICDFYGIPAQVTYENFMGCGIGACLGCVINTKNGQKRVCKDGPVFHIDELIWE